MPKTNKKPTRDTEIRVRVTAKDKALFTKAAARVSLPVSAWMRMTAARWISNNEVRDLTRKEK